MKLIIICILALTVAVESANHFKLKRTPRGISYVDWGKYMGKWFEYAFIHSRRWAGAIRFTDWVAVYRMNNYPQFTITDHWSVNDGLCSKTTANCTVSWNPMSRGSYYAEDHIGDLWSGNLVIVDMDPNADHYQIRWACNLYRGDVCVDYWVNVATRYLNLAPEILDRINRKLWALWETSLSDMALVHFTNPCAPY